MNFEIFITRVRFAFRVFCRRVTRNRDKVEEPLSNRYKPEVESGSDNFVHRCKGTEIESSQLFLTEIRKLNFQVREL